MLNRNIFLHLFINVILLIKCLRLPWRPWRETSRDSGRWQSQPFKTGAHVGDAAWPALFGVSFVEASNISTFGDPEGFRWETAIILRTEITYRCRNHVEVFLRWFFNNQGRRATCAGWAPGERLPSPHQHALSKRDDGHCSGLPIQEKRDFLRVPTVRHVPHPLFPQRHSHAEEPVSGSRGAVLSQDSPSAVSRTGAPGTYTCLHAHLQRHRSQEIPLSFHW